MDLVVEPAGAGDIDAILGLRDRAASWLQGRGVTQWAPGEIPREMVAQRIDMGTVWVVRKDCGAVQATVTVMWDDTSVWGTDGSDATAGYVHMLVADRQLAGARMGARLLHWAEAHIAGRGKALARLDCVAGNERLRSYYESAGYRFVRVVGLKPPWHPAALFGKHLRDR